MTSTDPVRLYRYRDGLYAADLLTAAIVHLDLFTWLADHPSPLEGICQHFDIQPRPADVLLTLCAANGLVVSRGGQFVATDLAREHLTRQSPYNLAPYYASLKDRPVVRDFVRVLRNGRPAHWGGERDGLDWHAAMETTAFAESFTAAMDCRGHLLGPAMAAAIDLGGRSRVLDIGGGSGVYACAVAAAHPDVSAVVLEQPPVDDIARRLVAERGFADRVTVHPGDLFRDPWPDDCDVHLFSNVLHDWDIPEVRHLLALSARSLRAGGLLVIHEAFLNEEKTGPLPVAEYSAILMHSTQGKCYSTGEYRDLLTDAGFGGIAYRDTLVDRGVMTATRGTTGRV